MDKLILNTKRESCGISEIRRRGNGEKEVFKTRYTRDINDNKKKWEFVITNDNKFLIIEYVWDCRFKWAWFWNGDHECEPETWQDLKNCKKSKFTSCVGRY